MSCRLGPQPICAHYFFRIFLGCCVDRSHEGDLSKLLELTTKKEAGPTIALSEFLFNENFMAKNTNDLTLCRSMPLLMFQWSPKELPAGRSPGAASWPAAQPASEPANQPDSQPAAQPASRPACQPTNQPGLPTGHPAGRPDRRTAGVPTECFLEVTAKSAH